MPSSSRHNRFKKGHGKYGRDTKNALILTDLFRKHQANAVDGTKDSGVSEWRNKQGTTKQARVWCGSSWRILVKVTNGYSSLQQFNYKERHSCS